MKTQTILKFLALLWVSTLLFSCDPEIDLSQIDTSVQIDQALVVPIGEATVSVQDILTQLKFDNSLGSDPDSIMFETNFTKQYDVPDKKLIENPVSIIKNFNLNPYGLPPFTVYHGFEISNITENLNLGLSSDPNQVVNSVVVKSAILQLKISKTNLNIVPQDLVLTLEFPNFENKTGGIVTKDVQVNQFGILKDIIISDFIMNLNGAANTPMKILFKTGNSDITVNPGSTLDLEIKINSVNFEVAYGKFEISSLKSNTLTIPLDMLSSIPKGLRFADPRATISVESTLGIRLLYDIKSVEAFSKNYPRNSVFASFREGIDSASTPTPTVINRATIKDGIVTSAISTLKSLDKSYGKTYNLFDTSVQRDSLRYTFSVKSDSSDPVPMFITPGMKMNAKINVQVPLQLAKGSSIEMKDTISIDGDKINLGSIDSCSLVMSVTNKLPARVALIASFPDANNLPIIPDQIYYIEAPTLNNLGLVDFAQTFVVQPKIIKLTKEQTVKLKNAKKMIYTLRFIGEDQNNTPKLMYFEKKNSFQVKLGIYVKANATI